MDWTKPRWLTAESEIEEAHRRAARGEGAVQCDGHPPARWTPDPFHDLPTPADLGRLKEASND